MQHNNTKYNILQWNLNGFYKRISELQIIINKYWPKIIGLQETNFTSYKKNTLKRYTNYTKIRANAIRANGGTSIFIKDSYTSEEIPLNTPLESVPISVQLKQKITICNLYLSNQSPFTETDLKNIIQQLPSLFILLGDFNSHNQLWGCITTNTRGKIIESVVDSENT